MRAACVAVVVMLGAWWPSQGLGHDWELVLDSGDKLRGEALEALVGDSVAISSAGQSQWVSVGSITEIRRIKEPWVGAGIGCLVGATICGVLAYTEDQSGTWDIGLSRGVITAAAAIAGGFAGAFIGAVVGDLADGDEVHDLSDKSYPERISVVEAVVAKHPTSSQRAGPREE